MHYQPNSKSLTDREQEILQLLARGYSNKELARALCITAGTVECHVHNILQKLGVDTRLQAALWLAREYTAGSSPSE